MSNEDELQEFKKDEIDIMQMLHKKKMYDIEKCFHKRGKGLSRDEFVKVMLEHLDYDTTDDNKIL